MASSKSKQRERRKLKRWAAYAVPLSDGSFVPAVLGATNVLFGGCALAIIDRQARSIDEGGELTISNEADVLAFLLTHPTFLKDGSWPLLTETVSIDPDLKEKLDAQKISNLVVYPVSVVRGFVEACIGIRDWDESLNERWKPQDLLLPGRRRPLRSRRRLSLLPK
jgi:hypothetical protein